MVKPLLKQLKKHRFEKKLQLRNWLANRFPSKLRLRRLNSRPVYAAELPVEGINEPPNTLSAERADRTTLQPSPPPKSPEPPEPDLPDQKKVWRWSLVWLAAFGILGGMGTAALIWLVSLPPQVDCRDPSRLSLDMERLYCAQEAAQTGDIAKLIAGIELLKQWQPEHPLYHEAQRLIEDWSNQVLVVATQRVRQGNLKGAEAALSHIPASTPVHADVQKSLARWRKYAKSAANIHAEAQTALKKRDWKAVSQQIVLLAEFERDYWELEKGADALAQQMGVEKQAWQTLIRAQKLAASGKPQQIGTAIPIAQQVPAKTYAAATAQTNLKQWSQKLVTIGTQKWQKGDRTGAVTALKLDSKVVKTPEIADLYTFSHAYKLANSALSEMWVPSLGGILNLREAIAAMEQVKSDSPFYAQAQAQKKDWQAQLENLIQLKYASTVAGLGQQSTLELAIGQAKQIGADQPLRVQAQSLIAYWRREAERLEDQPIVDQAMQFAQAGTINALQTAITQASQIKLGRALRGQAQTLIASWRSQIQTLEDRPKLDQAWQLAKQGNLGDAIDAASNIQPGRSLYREAQKAIAEWRYQQIVDAQIAQDQPILNRANALAESGDLSAAIDVASQIGSGRALYGQAQSSINRWQDQLNPPAPPSTNFTQPDYDSYDPSENPLDAPLDDEFNFSPAPPSGSNEASPFPSPTLLPGRSPAASPPATYQPFPQQPADGAEPNLPPVEPPVERSPAPSPSEPQPPDPLPPDSPSLDPLPPNL